MRVGWAKLLVLVLALTGCVSKARAKREAEQAYAAGRQDALLHLQQIRGPSVTVAGPVRTPLIPWTPELTLAQAILAATYTGDTDPKQIVILRQGTEVPVSPEKLLQGEDVPLQAGDIIKIQ